MSLNVNTHSNIMSPLTSHADTASYANFHVNMNMHMSTSMHMSMDIKR